jgi:type I restriction enzyme, S subunit
VSLVEHQRLKRVVECQRVRATDDADGPYIGLENIESWTGRLAAVPDAPTHSEGEGEGSAAQSQSNSFQPGDILFGKLRPYLAKAWVADFAGRCTTEALVMRALRVEPRFLLYVLLQPSFINAVNSSTYGSKMPRAEWDFIGSVPVPVPRHDVQHTVAIFLDRETARLDALVAAKQRLLDLLAEKRKAIIATAVTRGLDPKVKLRDSGVPWLGEIPAHWELWKVGHLAKVGNGSTPERDKAAYWSEGSFPWLNSSVVNQDEVTSSDQLVTEVALRECHLPRLQPGTVLVAITGQGKTRGQAVVLLIEATINQHMAFVAPNPELVDTWFLRWSFYRAYDYLRSISDDAGGTKGALTCEDVAGLRIPVPPPDEQRAIVEHIARVTAKLDAVRAATERTIALLKERRSALIAAAVTGQLDVGAAA